MSITLPRRLAHLCLGLATLAASLPALAQQSQLFVTRNVHSTSFLEPGSGEQRFAPTYNWIDDPRRAVAVLKETATCRRRKWRGRGFDMAASTAAAFASASYPYGFDAQGHRVNYGYAGAGHGSTTPLPSPARASGRAHRSL